MKKLFFFLILPILFTSCGSKTTSNEENNSGLSITPDNIDQIKNDFTVDYQKGIEKYGGKEVTVVITINPVDPYTNGLRDGLTFNYQNKTGYKGLPIINTEPGLRISTDLKQVKENNDSLQGYLQLTSGRTQGFLHDLYPEDNKYYLVYDKKHNIILTHSTSELVSLYIRLQNHPEPNSEDINNVLNIIGNTNQELLKNLKEGNLYYYSDKYGDVETTVLGNGLPDVKRYTSPTQTITKGSSEPYLIPCKYTIKGTVSKDIKVPTSNSGVTMIDLNLVNTQLLKVEWLVDRNTFFSKQVVYKETTSTQTPPNPQTN